MLNYAALSGRGALLLVTEPAPTKSGPHDLMTQIDEWQNIYLQTMIYQGGRLAYQSEGLVFLSGRLRDRKVWLTNLIQALEAA